MKSVLALALCASVFMNFHLLMGGTINTTTQEYRHAEIVECTAIGEGEYAVTFEVNHNEALHSYRYVSTTRINEKSLYLLNMDTMGTSDLTDDEILAIWESVG